MNDEQRIQAALTRAIHRAAYIGIDHEYGMGPDKACWSSWNPYTGGGAHS